jgi:acetyltransferase-like isoleucine patch superfamily enzyme/acyl carrier protein
VTLLDADQGWLDRARSRFWLRVCDRVGTRARVLGRPHVINSGELLIGDDFELRSQPTVSHLIVGDGASLRIGNQVRISAGAAVSCLGKIEIEDDVSIGAFCMLMDSDFHVAGDATKQPEARTITIQRGARVGHRVVVLPGSRIGAGAIVLPGSVVAGEVPPGATVTGNPARLASAESEAPGEDLPSLIPHIVQRALGISRTPALDEARERIQEWDSLGTLRLILELEDRFQITLSEDDVNAVRTIRDLVARVSAALSRAVALRR